MIGEMSATTPLATTMQGTALIYTRHQKSLQRQDTEMEENTESKTEETFLYSINVSLYRQELWE
jgi:hypothetical protein